MHRATITSAGPALRIGDLSSSTSDGMSVVRIGSVLEKDVDTTVQEVRDRVSQIRPEPRRDAETPIVQKSVASISHVTPEALAHTSLPSRRVEPSP